MSMQSQIPVKSCHVGKMNRWHRQLTMIGMVLSLGTGIAWFVFEDLLNQPVYLLYFWVSFHGITGHLFLCILGMAFYHHVNICVRLKRNRLLGGVFLGSSVALVASILALYYGRGDLHHYAHVFHLLAGSLTGIIFFLHIYIGRKVFIQKAVVIQKNILIT